MDPASADLRRRFADLGPRRLAAVMALRLATGREPGPAAAAVDWGLVFGVALRERCAVLGWAQSAAAIRASAPRDIVARWRSHAIDRQAYAERQLRVLGETVRTLEAHGVESVVLKGAPLSQRLYGDHAVRASVDIDLFVATSGRGAAQATLLASGWSLVEGALPWTQTFMRDAGSDRFHLEVHSSIVDLNLSHLSPRAPLGSRQRIGDLSLCVHDDILEPAYLAAHASKHMPVALIYDVDFQILWSALRDEQRSVARSAAAAAGLGGYLTWMIRRADALMPATEGDVRALAVLGVGEHGRTGGHAMFRDVMLAPSPLAAVHAVGAWVWPPHLRGTPGLFARRCLQRAHGSWARHVRKRVTYAVPPHRERPG